MKRNLCFKRCPKTNRRNESKTNSASAQDIDDDMKKSQLEENRAETANVHFSNGVRNPDVIATCISGTKRPFIFKINNIDVDKEQILLREAPTGSSGRVEGLENRLDTKLPSRVESNAIADT